MVRPQKNRKRKYKSYYQKEVEDCEVPESTLRYKKKRAASELNQPEDEEKSLSDESNQSLAEDQHDVERYEYAVQTSNSFFEVHEYSPVNEDVHGGPSRSDRNETGGDGRQSEDVSSVKSHDESSSDSEQDSTEDSIDVDREEERSLSAKSDTCGGSDQSYGTDEEENLFQSSEFHHTSHDIHHMFQQVHREEDTDGLNPVGRSLLEPDPSDGSYCPHETEGNQANSFLISESRQNLDDAFQVYQHVQCERDTDSFNSPDGADSGDQSLTDEVINDMAHRSSSSSVLVQEYGGNHEVDGMDIDHNTNMGESDRELSSSNSEPNNSDDPDLEDKDSTSSELPSDSEPDNSDDPDSEPSTEDEDSTSSSSESGHSDDSEHSDQLSANDENEANEMRDPFERLKRKLQGSFQQNLNLTVNISVGEVLINALTLVHTHNWSHLEKEHLLSFASSILSSGSILPSSRYLLDSYLYSKENMWFYFFCSECSKSLHNYHANAIRPAQIICPHCKTVNIISDLAQASYFVTFNVPSQIEVLLSDPDLRRKLFNPRDFVNRPADDLMRDLHHGCVYKQFANYVTSNVPLNTKVISFTVSIDSASLCRSFGGQSFCPVFLAINELPPVLRMGNLLLAGLWFGRVKEKLDLLLPPIIEHIAKLSINGFNITVDNEIWKMIAYLLGCCADSVARCDVQGIHAHRGDFPCSWCLVEGEEYRDENGKKKRIFRYMEPAPVRTLEELLQDSMEALRTKSFVNGVKYLTPLAAAPLFHAVNGFIVDMMHAKDEGTTKAFLSAWLGEEGGGPFHIGSAENQKKINTLLKQATPPKEVRKGVRKLKDLPYWTGREFENWGMFLSIPILKNILPERYLKHWALYVQGNYILLSSELPFSAVDVAESLLEKFCSETEGLYHARMMRFNLHILRHFADNARRWGPIFAVSAYGFEAGIQTFKKRVHSARYIPNQICRALSEENALILLKRHCGSVKTQLFEESLNRKKEKVSVELPGKILLLHKESVFTPTREEDWFIRQMEMRSSDFTVFTEIQKDGCHYGFCRARKTDNTFARLANSKFIHLKKILYHEATNAAWAVASLVRCEPSPYCPQEVVRLHPSLCFLYNVISVDEDISFYEVSSLSNICVSLQFSHGHYLSPMPNIFNMY